MTQDDFLRLNADADIISVADDGRIEAVYLTAPKTGWREFPWAATLELDGREVRRVLDNDEAARFPNLIRNRV